MSGYRKSSEALMRPQSRQVDKALYLWSGMRKVLLATEIRSTMIFLSNNCMLRALSKKLEDDFHSL